MYRYFVAAFALLALVLLPGVVVKRGPPSGGGFIKDCLIADGAPNLGTELPTCTVNQQFVTERQGWMYVPTGTSIRIDTVIAVINAGLLTAGGGSDESCVVQLVSSTDFTDITPEGGTALTTTAIHMGPNSNPTGGVTPANDCTEGDDLVLNAVGESCTLTGLNLTLTGPIKWAVDLVDPDVDTGNNDCAAAADCVCDEMQGMQYTIVGEVL